MDDTPQDAWFFTREGEKTGPVTLAELRAKAAEGELHPRQDMVWCAGMEAWTPAGGIEGLFERKAPEIHESLAPPAEPYRASAVESVAESLLREGEWAGARRRSFLIAVLLFPPLWHLIFAFAVPFLTTQFGPEITHIIVIGSAFIPLVVSIWFGLARFVNLGMSRWWILGNLVPILNFWVGYWCFACPAGYGYHKKLDGPGIFLAIIYWLILAITLLAVAAVVALFLGAIGDPEMQDQIREAIREATRRANR